MTDSDTHEAGTHETEAELRLSRVQALNGSDLVAVVTYLLAKHPDTFPAMLDDALSSVSPRKS
jgi:D-serine deaminase-like pyridoxal phosphate-dependent protein